MEPATQILESQNWKITSPKRAVFSSNQVIDTYLTGKKQGLQQAQKLLLDKLEENVKFSSKSVVKVLNFLRKKGFHPLSTFLRIKDWANFEILITVPENEFVSKDFLRVYDFVSDLERKIETELFRLTLSFTDQEKDFDIDYITSEGYLLKYKMD